MYLLVDAQPIQSPGSGPRGIGRYTRNFLRGLAQVRPDWNVVLVQNAALPPIKSEEIGGFPVETFNPPLPHQFTPVPPIETKEANERFFADWLTARRPDAVLLPSIFEYETIVPLFGSSRPTTYAILYDLIPLMYSEQYLMRAGRLAFNFYAQRIRQLLQMDTLFAISQASADDFRRIFPDAPCRVINIRGAIDPRLSPLPEADRQRVFSEIHSRLSLTREFILFLGGPDFRKNVLGALRGYAALDESLRNRYQLIVAGFILPADRERYEDLLEEWGIEGQVCFAGYVSEEELRVLYQACRVFYFPSLYEGLGLPILEALSFGAPIVTSNRSSMPEYGGSVAWYADPTQPDQLGQALREALTEPADLRRDERLAFARSFTWPGTAEVACRALETPVTHQPVTPPPPRVAWITQTSALDFGEYDRFFLRELTNHVELEVVVDDLTRLHEAVPADLWVLGRHEVEGRHSAHPYQLFIYNLSDRRIDREWLELMTRYPGLILLNETSVKTIEQWACLQGGPDSSHPDPFGIINRAQGIIVSTEELRKRMCQMVSPPVSAVPTGVCLHPLAAVSHERMALVQPLGRMLVGTRVSIDGGEEVKTLLRAVDGLPTRIKSHIELLVLGSLPPSEWHDLEQSTANLTGLNVQFLRDVDCTLLPRYERIADVWVQLQGSDEASSRCALLRAMAAQTACLTSEAGALAELPHTILRKIRAGQTEEEDLRATLERLVQQPRLRSILGERAREYVESTHDLSAIGKQWVDSIHAAIASCAREDRPWQEFASGALVCAATAIADDVCRRWSELRAESRTVRPRGEPIKTESVPTVEPQYQNGSIPLIRLYERQQHNPPRRLWIDVSYIYLHHRGHFTGICRTIVSILRELMRVPQLPIHFCVFRELENPPYFTEVPRRTIEQVLRAGAFVNGGESRGSCRADNEVEFDQHDVLFLPELCVFPCYCEELERLKQERGIALVPVVYDLIGCRSPQWFGTRGIPDFWGWALTIIRNADVVCSISEHTKRDILWLAEENQLPAPSVEVFRLGDEELYLGSSSNLTEVGGLTASERFVLLVSTVEVRKNHQLVYQVWRKLLQENDPKDIPLLVFVGAQGWLTQDLVDLVRSDPLTRDHIIWMSNINDQELNWLYRQCLFTLYPSHYEGWGLPIAESLAFGKYCIASDNSSMPEIGGPLVDYHDPCDLVGCLRLVERAIFDEEYRHAREARIRANYRTTSWRDCAVRLMRIWEQYLGSFPSMTQAPASTGAGDETAPLVA